MADNVAITAGSGTTIAADDIGAGVLAQRVKPVFDVDGTGTDVSASNPLPVVLTGTPTAAVPVTDNSGSLTVDAPVGTPVFATVTPSTTGGWSVSSQTALSNTKTQVKSGAATFGGYAIYNPNTSAVYVQVWDVANGSITVGTTAPTYVIGLPPGAGANVEYTAGINHATAINVAATTTATGGSAPATALTGFFLYK